MSRNNNDEFLIWMVMLVLGGVALFVYFQVKSFADWVGISWSAGFYMLAGIFLFAGGVLFSLLKGWLRAIPWMLPATFWFFTPALNDKAHGGPLLGAAAFRSDGEGFSPWREYAWYGNGWWQIAIFIGLLGIAWVAYKLLDDGY